MHQPAPFFAVLLFAAPTVIACKPRSDGAPAPAAGPSGSAAASASASAPTVGTKIEPSLPKPGAARRDVITRRMEFEGTAGAPKLTIEERLERQVKIVGASPEAVTKVTITYGKVTTTVTEGEGPPKVTSDPRAEKAYTLALELGQPTVTDAEGKAVPDALAQVMTSDHVELGLPFPLPSLLPEQPLRQGADFDLSHDVVLALFPVDADADFDVTRVKLAFTGEKATKPWRTADFTLATRFWGVHGGRRIELDLAGKLTARLPAAWPERVTLEGPAKLLATSGDDPALARPGRASIALDSTYE